MNPRIALTALSVVAICTGCASGAGASGQASLAGTASYRERMALPPDAVLEVTLEDVSRADAAAEVLGRTRLESPGQPPIKFTITYDPARLIDGHRYNVRARITRADSLMFVTDTAYPVLLPGPTGQLDLLLQRAGSASTNASIENTEWRLVRLASGPVIVANPQNPPRLTLQSSDQRVTGSGGCNRLMGSYTLEGNQLKFGRMAGTMMACAQGMEQERAFHDALAKVTAWRMTGQTLELLNADAQPILMLEK